MEAIYKRIRHMERPFVLHLAYKIPTSELVKKLNRHKGKAKPIEAGFFDHDGSAVAHAYDLNDHLQGHFIIIFHDIPDTPTIAHEAFHCVARHFRSIGQPLDESSEESYAYMLDWMTSLIFKTLKKPL